VIDQGPVEATPIDDIIVTAARLPAAAGEAAFSVIRLEDKVLNRSTRLDEALAQVPAVSLFRRNTSRQSDHSRHLSA
jgi:outer membrane cobalamin receptor